jgi:hypothetical protein
MDLSKLFYPKKLDLLLYKFDLKEKIPEIIADIPIEILKKKTLRTIRYSVNLNGKEIHHSEVFKNLYLLHQFGYKIEPAIGNCETHSNYRGMKIFPNVLSSILLDLQLQENKCVYILVSPNNFSSIHGIEHVGFKKNSHLFGTRIGPILFSPKQNIFQK